MRAEKLTGRQRPVALYALSGENSRGKVQNVVANSTGTNAGSTGHLFGVDAIDLLDE